MRRRRPPVAEEQVEEYVEERPVRRRPPLPSDEPWAWILLAALLIGGGVVVAILLTRGDDKQATTPTRTVVETRTAPSTTVVETETPTTTQAAETGTMPEAVGLDLGAAAALVEAAGLIPDSYPVASDSEAGRVVAQNPEPGTQLAQGEHVRLNVSTGPGSRAATEVPDVTGPAEADARRTAIAAGFTVRTQDSDAPTAEELGEAVDQAPATGSTAPAWSQITIYVGR